MRSTTSRLQLALTGAVLVLAGCTPGSTGAKPTPSDAGEASPSSTPLSPKARAERALNEAALTLAAAPGIHYRGKLVAGGIPMNVDLRIAGSGATYGRVKDRRTQAAVLSVGESTFIKAGTSFWIRDVTASGDPLGKARKLKYLAARWVEVEPSVIGDPATALRPSSLANELRAGVRKSGVSDVRRAVTNGVRVDVVQVGAAKYHVSAARPHRLVKLEQSTFGVPGRASRGGERSTPDEDEFGDESGLDFDEMDAPEIDDLYDDVGRQTKKLNQAVDAKVKLKATVNGQMQCPGGSCTLTVNVANTVAKSRDVVKTTGVVKAELRGTISGPSGSRPCAGTATMAPNSSAIMRCSAAFRLPSCRQRLCTYNFRANFFVISRASLNVTAMVRKLQRDRQKDRDDAECRTSNSFVANTPVLLADGRRRPIESVSVGSRVLAANATTGGLSSQRVGATHSSLSTTPLLQITVDVDGPNGSATGSVVSTRGHRFLTLPAHVWTSAGELGIGSRLVSRDGAPVEVLRVSRLAGRRPVFDLSVSNTHTYFVGAGPAAVLVHNKPPEGCGIIAGPNPGFDSITVIRQRPTGNRGETFRLDVESFGPGRPGNIHVQLKGPGHNAQNSKYYYRPAYQEKKKVNGREVVIDHPAAWLNSQGDTLRKSIVKLISRDSLAAAYRFLNLAPPP